MSEDIQALPGTVNDKPDKNIGSFYRQLIIWLLAIGLIPLFLISILNYQHARESIIGMVERQLLADSESTYHYIKNWFDYRMMDVRGHSESENNRKFLVQLIQGFNGSGVSLKEYIGSSDWNRSVGLYARDLQRMRNEYDYLSDVYLIDIDGNILFSFLRENDLGTNLNTGPYAQTQFSNSVARAKKNNVSTFSDIEHYPPSSDRRVGFVTAPILDKNDHVLGVMSFQIKLDRVEGFLGKSQAGAIQRYIVGGDSVLRSRLSEEGDILSRKIDLTSVIGVNSELGRSQSKVQHYRNPDGVDVLVVARAMSIGGVRWVLVAEESKQYALSPVVGLARLSILLVFFTLCFIVGAAFYLARRFSFPVVKLVENVELAIQGDMRKLELSRSGSAEFYKLSLVYNEFINRTMALQNMLLDAIDGANSARKEKSQFLACMSHEIRTPMNGVLGMLGLLKKTPMGEAQKIKLDTAHESALSLLSLLNDILDYSKVESGKIELEDNNFSLNEIISSVIYAFSKQADKKGLEIIFDANSIASIYLRGDAGRVRQILSNLIGNAIKFTEAGEIIISAEVREVANDHVQLECRVKDTGIGIAEELYPRLFDSFTQADGSSTRKYGGVGLGLAICKDLCGLMGGSIHVESTVGKGSCFTFDLQLAHVEDEAKNVPYIDMQEIRVLVVDDIALNREIFHRQLSLWGAEVDEAESAAQGLEKCRQATVPYDVILVDYLMPDDDGKSFARALKSDVRFAKQNMLMLSSASGAGDIRELQEIGFAGCLSKPVMPQSLYNAMAVIVENKHLAQEGSMVTASFLDALIDPNIRKPKSVDTQRFNGQRILIVEDNYINQEVALEILSEYELICDIADNGLEALRCLKRFQSDTPYSLILMDCQMPILDGYEASRCIRNGEVGVHYSEIPIIALTANVMRGDKEKCLMAGMSDYLPKPIDAEVLEQALLKWMPEAKSSQSTQDKIVTVSASTDIELEAIGEEYNPVQPMASAVQRKTKNEPKNSDVLKIPGNLRTIDFEKNRPSIARRPKSYLKILSAYIKQNSDFVEHIRALYEEQSFLDMREKVHAIKGACGNLGMMSLFEMGADLELKLIENKTVDVPEFDAFIQGVQDSLKDAELILASNAGDGAQNIDTRAFSDVVFDMRSRLMSSAMIPSVLEEEFTAMASEHIGEDKARSIAEYLESYDFDEVLNLIEDF